MFISVDFPAPFSPTRPRTRPRSTESSTSRSTGTPKKPLRDRRGIRGADSSCMVSAPRRDAACAAASSSAASRITPPLTIMMVKFDRPSRFRLLSISGDEQHAETVQSDLALAAEQARAADHAGADHVEQDPRADRRRAGLQPGRVEDRADRGAEAADDVGGRDDPAGRARPRSRRPSRFMPDRVEPAARRACAPSTTCAARASDPHDAERRRGRPASAP